MSAAQTLLFVALPNGLRGSSRLGVSIFMAPRLSGAAVLSDFPDLLDWTDLIHRHGLKLTLTSGGASQEVAVGQAGLRPDLWKEVFKPATFVERIRRSDLDQRLLVSYPHRTAHDFLRWGYQTAGLGQGFGEQRLLEMILSDLVFRDDNGQRNIDQVLSARRITMWEEQNPSSVAQLSTQAFVPGPTLPQKPAATREMVERLALFHGMPPAPGGPPLPSTPAEFAKVLDFHKAISALGAYPSLMRALGLVFDLEIPAAVAPPSPVATAYGEIWVSAVAPGWKWHVTPKTSLPHTAYVRDAKDFRPAPAATPAEAAAGAYAPADVAEGFLTLNPSDFELVNVELDGAMLKALVLAEATASVDDGTRIEQVLPSLRSGGISLIADDRAKEVLRAISDNTAFQDAEDSGAAFPRAFDARDLTRGYRLDVWSSQDRAWRSLHRRDGTYSFGPDGGLVFSTTDEEGFTQLGVAQPAPDPTRPSDPASTAAGAPQPGTDLFVHERIARWHGWSLSAPRPGRPFNRSGDPAHAADDDPTAEDLPTPFKMKARYVARAGSLPRLRFGARYRMRVRTADLAGNSPPLAEATPPAFVLPPGPPAPYFRFEPAPPPVVVPLSPPKDGASLLRLVIRSHNTSPDLDFTATAEIDERHLVPPKADVLTVEHHGGFDDATGHVKSDKATYDLIVERDKGAFAKIGNTPVEPKDQAPTPWFPDPIARGVALRDLPGTPNDTAAVATAASLAYTTLPDVEPRPGSVTHVPFGEPWPDRRAFRLILAEGRSAPRWNAAARTLTVFLPKASETDIPASSYVSPADLELMGVWDWLRAWFDIAELVAMQDNGSQVVLAADARGRLTRLVLEGGHEMITPAQTLSLVHAVQQPIGRPAWTVLPVQHDPGQPKIAAALKNAFSPITAWRSLGSHHAVLLGGLKIHGASTVKITVQARWTEFIDDVSKPGPTTRPAADHVEMIEIRSLAGGMLAADGAGERYVASYIPQVDTLWFAAPFDVLPGVNSPSQVAAPVHQFGDTTHRRVRYYAVGASRFQEYFPEPGLDYARTSDPLMVSVPSSARPAAPDALYVVPTFGWERQETTNVKTEVRQGGGLRVYLSRPWYSSGQNELLGVALWPQASGTPVQADRNKYKHWFTQWGSDPIWDTNGVYAIPTIDNFPEAVASDVSRTLEATDLQVDVAGHTVEYDAERRLWFSDVVVSTGGTYGTFVRLALARYQPASIAGTELSHVVLTDFAQLTPDRSAALTVDPADVSRGRLFVGGVGPTAPTRNLITVTVEANDPAIGGDLGWKPASSAQGRAVEDSPAPVQPASALWQGEIVFPSPPAPGAFRVVIREYELFETDGLAPAEFVGPLYAERLVYASIIPWDFRAP